MQTEQCHDRIESSAAVGTMRCSNRAGAGQDPVIAAQSATTERPHRGGSAGQGPAADVLALENRPVAVPAQARVVYRATRGRRQCRRPRPTADSEPRGPEP
ncbi:Piso0_005094 [Millerozyma farinosa CBS 7064]|uniref:Piso0_005094 protein n=1 Tax=Pichia sorbitophila (strain ATCC MYA-4447 / BCRC 22081 / CBS 7064 / NBRC 10061 / NRRL Y-12695) TaxID=559304 RepID=G8Y194_PICSO|nr:Piso0_005094 [Millerozyma farinosa CBS 7064]